ncbi:MAG: hypothetical protein Q8O00_16140 [Holophaga sp.]|nr:hypothetical protein [Holophaga sp.]
MHHAENTFTLGSRRMALVLFALLSLATLPAAGADPKPGKWMKELAGADGIGFTGYPQNLGWQAEHPASYPAPFLVVGKRPVNDTPDAGVKLSGAKQSETDWVIADTSGAVWVTGLLPAPKPGESTLITGRFATKDGQVALKGIRFILAGSRTGTTVAKSGDFVYFPLAGNKSTTCPVEVEGNAVEVAFTDQRDTLILRAVKPGKVKVKVFSLWFNDDKPTLLKELLLTVE